MNNLSGGNENTLAAVLDYTATVMGSRLLRRWLKRPLRNQTILKLRQQSFRHYMKTIITQQYIIYYAILAILNGEFTRIALKSARPRDLIQLRNALSVFPKFNIN